METCKSMFSLLILPIIVLTWTLSMYCDGYLSFENFDHSEPMPYWPTLPICNQGLQDLTTVPNSVKSSVKYDHKVLLNDSKHLISINIFNTNLVSETK